MRNKVCKRLRKIAERNTTVVNLPKPKYKLVDIVVKEKKKIGIYNSAEPFRYPVGSYKQIYKKLKREYGA